jgi:hypothetical protein
MMESVTIGFSKPKKARILSLIIRVLEGTKYSHVFVKLQAETLQRTLIYQAQGLSVHFVNKETFYGKNQTVESYVLPITKEEKVKILQFCIDHVGKPYGLVQIVGMGRYRLVKNWFNKKVRNPLKDKDKTFVCSEIVGHILKILDDSVDEKMFEVEGPRWINKKVKQICAERAAMYRHEATNAEFSDKNSGL